MEVVLRCFAFVFFAASLGAIKFRCDYTYSDVGWIKYHKMPETWHDARLRCRYEGGRLASPSSSELLAAMINATRNVDIITGIHATVSSGSFYTLEGTPLDDIPQTWNDNEPDNKNNNEQCISMSPNGYLSDVSCDVPRPYICHRPNTLVDANACGTPDPEYRYECRTKKCYKFHTTPRTFKRAHFVCTAEGGHLAIINSVTESQVIRDIFAQYPGDKIIGNFWKDVAFIGFHNYGEGSDWVTLDGHTLQEAGFTTFENKQPDNATEGEYCGSVFRSGLLNDLWCEQHFAFICEKDPNYPKLCENSMLSNNNKTEAEPAD